MSAFPENAAELAEKQRIDKWLFFARVTKSRTLAAALVSSGRIRVNRNRINRPAFLIQPGDTIVIALSRTIRILQVRKTGQRHGPAPEAQTLYTDLSAPLPPGTAAPLSTKAAGQPKKTGRLFERIRDAIRQS